MRMAGRKARIALALLASLLGFGPLSLQARSFDGHSFRDRLTNDRVALRIYRKNLAESVDLVRSLPHQGTLPPGLAAGLRGTWESFADNLSALDALGRYYSSFAGSRDPAERLDSLFTADWIFLTQYRYALDFLDAAQSVPGAVQALEGQAGPSAPSAFSLFRTRFQNPLRTDLFLSRDWRAHFSGSERWERSWERQVREDCRMIQERGPAPGPLLTLKDIRPPAENTESLAPWFPVEAGVAEWMGKPSAYRPGECRISVRQARSLEKLLEPGDLLLSRHDWCLSDVGLPGYWCHAALYMGDARQRKAYFNDPAVKAWVRTMGVRGGLEDLFSSKFHAKYLWSLKPGLHGRVRRVIEALSQGVLFTPWERFAAADSLAVLRPEVSKTAKALALYRAFRYAGRPYDFQFDFKSGESLCDPDLVVRAYGPSRGEPGLSFPMESRLGGAVCSPNSLAEQFDEPCGTPAPHWGFVLFLDGDGGKEAVERGPQDFRESWKRPKWRLPPASQGAKERP
jgi:Permuted papain-like amidase enzyme, YaeF/YiiX, C92 family